MEDQAPSDRSYKLQEKIPMLQGGGQDLYQIRDLLKKIEKGIKPAEVYKKYRDH